MKILKLFSRFYKDGPVQWLLFAHSLRRRPQIHNRRYRPTILCIYSAIIIRGLSRGKKRAVHSFCRFPTKSPVRILVFSIVKFS